MFYCFEGKCLDLIKHEYNGIGWDALLASLGVVERLTGEEVLHHIATGKPLPKPTVSASATAKKKKTSFECRKDERNFPVPDCRDGLTPPWDSNSEEARTARLAELDAYIEKEYAEVRAGLAGQEPDAEVRGEKVRKLRDPDVDLATVLTLDKEWAKWKKECWMKRHLPTCWFCDVPVDILQERLDQRFPISREEREAERKRIEGFFNYYQLQTTKDV
jgi:hypothetical protein